MNWEPSMRIRCFGGEERELMSLMRGYSWSASIAWSWTDWM